MPFSSERSTKAVQHIYLSTHLFKMRRNLCKVVLNCISDASVQRPPRLSVWACGVRLLSELLTSLCHAFGETRVQNSSKTLVSKKAVAFTTLASFI